MRLFDIFKRGDIEEDEFDPEVIERKARRIADDLGEMVEKYDERTEELVELLREKAEGLWTCRTYYDSAMQLKGEVKNLKSGKADLTQDMNKLKRQWGSMAEELLKSDMIKKPSTINDYESLITYLRLVQFTDKEDLPMRGLLAAMKRLHITKEDIEKDYIDIYNNLKMKDW